MAGIQLHDFVVSHQYTHGHAVEGFYDAHTGRFRIIYAISEQPRQVRLWEIDVQNGKLIRIAPPELEESNHVDDPRTAHNEEEVQPGFLWVPDGDTGLESLRLLVTARDSQTWRLRFSWPDTPFRRKSVQRMIDEAVARHLGK